MSFRKEGKKIKTRNRSRATSPTKIIALTFAGIILVGSLLLTLPVASRSGVSCGFRPALFTATSATCVTGLVLYDTYTQWSGFGQIVIISLIQMPHLFWTCRPDASFSNSDVNYWKNKAEELKKTAAPLYRRLHYPSL